MKNTVCPTRLRIILLLIVVDGHEGIEHNFEISNLRLIDVVLINLL